MSAAQLNRAAAGRAGRAASPWNRGPHATTPKARQSFKDYRANGERMATERATREAFLSYQDADPAHGPLVTGSYARAYGVTLMEVQP